MASVVKTDTITGLASATTLTLPTTTKIGATAIVSASAGSATIIAEGGTVVTNIQQGLLKHWINFGMDDAAINDSFNNTSVADIAAGDYTVTIANNFANAVYAISFEQDYVAGHGTVGHQSNSTTKTTTLVRVYAFTTNTGGAADTVEAMVQSAGDLA